MDFQSAMETFAEAWVAANAGAAQVSETFSLFIQKILLRKFRFLELCVWKSARLFKQFEFNRIEMKSNSSQTEQNKSELKR